MGRCSIYPGLGNPRGLMYTLNFSRPFQVSGNVTALFDTETKALGGSGNADDLGRNFQDGGLLANDAQVSLFGGLLLKSNNLRDPAPDETLTFQKYPHNRQEIGSWSEGFRVDKLGDEVTRYVAYGAAVSAPSEDKAWYFSGLRSETWGPIFENSLNTTERAMNVSDRLISVNMERQISPVWTNTTLHRSVMGRANAAVVWVPVGEQGILVVIGGVTYPEFIDPMTRTSENPAQSVWLQPSSTLPSAWLTSLSLFRKKKAIGSWQSSIFTMLLAASGSSRTLRMVRQQVQEAVR